MNENAIDIVDMEKLTQNLIHQYFPEVEGELLQIFGKVKNGKTLFATMLAWKDLMAGYTVAANWKIFWEGYDERRSRWHLFLGIIGLKKYYAKIAKENFIYLPPGDMTMLDRISRMTDVKIYLDEGHMYLDSYKLTKMSMEDRNTVLLTGHFNRSIIVVSQRPTAIHATVRGNVNRFFQVEKLFKIPFLPFTLFRVSEIQDMIGETPDVDSPERTFLVWGSTLLYSRYNYKSMRGDMPRSQPNYAMVWNMSWTDIRQRFFGLKIKELLDTPPLPPS